LLAVSSSVSETTAASFLLASVLVCWETEARQHPIEDDLLLRLNWIEEATAVKEEERR
jgi:hypothetical protein